MTTILEHRYAHQIDPNGGSAAARLARMIEPGLRVLELGTGPGTVTRILHGKGCRVTGVELDAEAIELCRPFCERIIQGDLTSNAWFAALQGERFNAIVIADVLEHLPRPQELLEQLPALLTPEGFVVISLPNASHLSVLGCLLGGVFPYQTKGLLDHTHLRFFGRKDFEGLLNASGFMWQRWESVELDPAQSELQPYWQNLSDADRAYLQERTVDGLVYQHVTRAYPSSEAGHLAKLKADLADGQAALRDMERSHAEQLAEQQAQHQRLLQDRQDCIAGLEEKTAALEAQIRQLQQAVASHQAQMAALLNSRSWRITRPLRRLSQWLTGSPGA